MKKLLITLLCLVAVISFAGVTQYMQMVVARKNVAAGGGDTIFTEDFDAPGFENSWVLGADSNGIFDQSNTTTSVTGSYSFFIDGSANTGEPDAWYYFDLGANLEFTSYGRVYLYMTDGNAQFDPIFVGGGPDTTYQGAPAFRVAIDDGGSDVDIYAYARANDGGVINTTISEWHLLEWKYDHVANTMDWKLDGTNQTQVTGSSARNFRYVYIGLSSLGEAYVDALAIGTNDWIGPIAAGDSFTLVQEVLSTESLSSRTLGDTYGCWSSQNEAAESHDVTKVSILVHAVGTITGNATCYIYTSTDVTSDNLTPDDRQATADATIDVSTITTNTDGEYLEFTFATPYSATITEYYSVVLCWDAGDASNNLIVHHGQNLTPVTEFLVSRRSGDGLPNATNDAGNWTGVNGSESFMGAAYKSP